MDSRLKNIGKVIGIFAVLGLGLGLAGFIVLDQMVPKSNGQEQSLGQALVSGLLILEAIAVMYFLGPAMAVVSGIYSGRQDDAPINSALAGGVGSFIGFYVMFILAFLIMSLAFPETNGGGGGGDSATNLGNNLVQMILVGIPTGVVGAITGVLTSGDI